MIIVSLYIADNFLFFLFVLEVTSIIYLFFILSFLKTNLLTLIKLKNFLNTYMWLSFVTLMFFSIGIFLVIKYNGTLTFSELWCVDNATPSYV
jgi:hypothetical protein